MKVLSVTSEIYPFVKTGGLADVTGALPKCLQKFGIRTITLVPGYPSLLPAARAPKPTKPAAVARPDVLPPRKSATKKTTKTTTKKAAR